MNLKKDTTICHHASAIAVLRQNSFSLYFSQQDICLTLSIFCPVNYIKYVVAYKVPGIRWYNLQEFLHEGNSFKTANKKYTFTTFDALGMR